MKGFFIAGVVSLLLGISIFQGELKAAEPFPAKPIIFIAPYEAGTDADILIRPLCKRVSALLGKPLMTVYKPGAGSSIGYRELRDAKPDGYTIGWVGSTIIANKLQGILPFDHEAFTLLGTYATITPVVVGATKSVRPFKTIEEVLAFAKAHPEEVSIATAAVGQNWWIAAMAFQAGTGLKFNMVLQPGTGAYVMAQVAGGHTDLGVTGLASPKAQVDAGNARLLAIFGSKRAPAPYDNVPSFKEIGYDILWEAVQAVMGPSKMPKEITEKLATAFETAANEPEFRKFVAEQNCMPFYLGPDQFLRFLNEQKVVCRSIMGKAGILKEK